MPGVQDAMQFALPALDIDLIEQNQLVNTTMVIFL